MSGLTEEVVDALLAAGCTAEQLAAAIKADIRSREERTAAKREQDRIRKRRQRENEKPNDIKERVHDVTRTERDTTDGADSQTDITAHARVYTNPPTEGDNIYTKTTPNGVSKSSGAKPSKPSPRSELEAVLDAEHADAVLEHRQRIRKPLTVRAAHLLAAKLSQAPDPNAAADVMVLNGWQGFELSWMENRTRGSPRSSPKDELIDALDKHIPDNHGEFT